MRRTWEITHHEDSTSILTGRVGSHGDLRKSNYVGAASSHWVRDKDIEISAVLYSFRKFGFEWSRERVARDMFPRGLLFSKSVSDEYIYSLYLLRTKTVGKYEGRRIGRITGKGH